jgi:Protein of unknown function (DUF3140)/Hypervirulence associated proteins TUDOR domain
MAVKSFSKGDEVEWKSHGQNVKGAVQEKSPRTPMPQGRTVRESKENPQYRVKSSKTGADAVHKITSSEFHHTVNMTAAELEKWLATAESKKVGQKSGSKESTGHASGSLRETAWRYLLMN